MIVLNVSVQVYSFILELKNLENGSTEIKNFKVSVLIK
jgi:hypothetical protein